MIFLPGNLRQYLVRKAYELLKAKGVNTTFEWNQGNHFKDVDIRTAKAFAWALNLL